MRVVVFLVGVLSSLGCGWQELLHGDATLHLTIEVDDSQGTSADPDSAMDAVLEVLRARIDEYAGLRNARIERVDEGITVELFGAHDVARVKSIIQPRGFFEARLLTDGEDFTDVLPALDSLVLAASPNLDETSPLSSLLRESGKPGMLLVDEAHLETAQEYLALPEVRDKIPESVDPMWGRMFMGVVDRSLDQILGSAPSSKPYHPLYLLEPDPVVTNEDVERAYAIPDRQSGTLVLVELTREGGRIFEQVTSENIGKGLAIILDRQVQSSPLIREAIGRRVQIELGEDSSLEEAQDLALFLKTRALPVPIRIVEERTTVPEQQPE